MKFIKNIFGSKKIEFQEPNILIEESSPNCPITAIVEQDNRVAYMYLWGAEGSGFGVKTCWIRNLDTAPKKVDEKLLKKGIPPMMPSEYCINPLGRAPLQKDSLSIVWLEEGDGAALLENNEPIAIIPSWSGTGGFNGYSKESKGRGEFGWELNQTNELLPRIADSVKFWELCSSEMNPFQIMQPKLLEIYEDLFGKSEIYYAIDDVERGAPIGLFVVDGSEKLVFSTVGLSLTPMPQIEMYAENRLHSNRIELGLMINSKNFKADIQKIASWIGSTCLIPWEKITFLGEGHTILFDVFENTQFNSVILSQELASLPKVQLDDYRNSKVNFLWLIPITQKERQFAIEGGSKTLIEKLNEIGEDVFSFDRNEVI